MCNCDITCKSSCRCSCHARKQNNGVVYSCIGSYPIGASWQTKRAADLRQRTWRKRILSKNKYRVGGANH